MLLDTIAPADGTTVGVAMPISVIFTNPVKASARAQIEKHMKITTSVPVTGAWHWFSDRPRRLPAEDVLEARDDGVRWTPTWTT